MRLFVRKILVKFINDSTKRKLKKWEFKSKQKLIMALPEIGEIELRNLLVDTLGVSKGDNLFVHASMSLLNTKLSSEEIFTIIKAIVGDKGSISVPCFPRMSSMQFMNSKKKFDILNSPSGMGDFSEYVRKRADSNRSFHPTKSIASVGLDKEILNGHNLCEYPFGCDSPYHKMLKLKPKVLGLGVPMSYLSFVHIAEDMNPEGFPLQVNENKKYIKLSIDEAGHEVDINTYVHDMKVVVKANPEKYVRNNLNKKYWKSSQWYLSPFFVVNGSELTEQINEDSINGITVYQ